MSVKFIIQRYWLNFKRHRMFFSLAIIIFAAVMALMSMIYPGPGAVEAYLSIPFIQLMTGIADVPDPGLLIWILLLGNSITLNIFYPVVGIFLGVKILPFNEEKEGKEIIFCTNKSILSHYLENLVIVIILIPLIMLPAYLISVGALILSGGVGEGVLALTVGSIIPMFFVLVVTMVTSLGSSIKSSPMAGYVFGGIFFIGSFTLSILEQQIDFVKDINLMSQMNTFQHAISWVVGNGTGTWNEEFIFKCLILSLFLIILSIFFIYRTDYIQTRSSYKETIGEEEKRGIKSKFSFIRTPVEFILSKVGWRFPAFRDQLQSSAGLFLIYLLVTSLIFMMVIVVYPGDTEYGTILNEIEGLLSNPIIAAFMFGHDIDLLPFGLGGFITYEIMIYNWIWYAPFLFIATYEIIIRDRNAGYDEITWSMPRTRTLIIIERTIAALVYLWMIVLVNLVVLWIGSFYVGMFTDAMIMDFSATALAFIFLGIGYSIFLVLFVALGSIPHPKYLFITMIGAFLVALFIPIVYYMNQDLLFFLYLSPFYYFDLMGIMLNDINLGKAILEILIFGIIIIGFFVSVLKFWTPKRDIA